MNSIYWIDSNLGGRKSISDKSLVFDNNAIENYVFICLEKNLPQGIQNNVRIIHSYFPKINPTSKGTDYFIAKNIVNLLSDIYTNYFTDSIFKNKKIVVYCGKGNDRTGIAILTYLCLFKKYSFNEAIKILKDKNHSALTYPGFESLAYNIFGNIKERELYKLRISVTSKCNFNCMYCNRKQLDSELNYKHFTDILSAAYDCGFRKIHWTGGEPLMCDYIFDVVKFAKYYGYNFQTLTTNGTTLINTASKLKSSGIDRINISIDSFDMKTFSALVGLHDNSNKRVFDTILTGIKETLNHYDIVKINICVLKNNISVIKDAIEFASNYPGRLVLKFLELVPCQNCYEYDKSLFDEQFVSIDNIKNAIIDNYGFVEETESPIYSRQKCKYFKIQKNGVIFGLNPNKSINYACQRTNCKDFRINPSGFMSDCSVNLENLIYLPPLDSSSKRIYILDLIEKKEKRKQEDWDTYLHRQKHYTFWRFGYKYDGYSK